MDLRGLAPGRRDSPPNLSERRTARPRSRCPMSRRSSTDVISEATGLHHPIAAGHDRLGIGWNEPSARLIFGVVSGGSACAFRQQPTYTDGGHPVDTTVQYDNHRLPLRGPGSGHRRNRRGPRRLRRRHTGPVPDRRPRRTAPARPPRRLLRRTGRSARSTRSTRQRRPRRSARRSTAERPSISGIKGTNQLGASPRVGRNEEVH